MRAALIAFLLLAVPWRPALAGEGPSSSGGEGWRPWGEEAFDEARREGKPVLLLVGEWPLDPAAVAPGRVVPVAVDRVERPDVADLYATAYTLLPSGSMASGP